MKNIVCLLFGLIIGSLSVASEPLLIDDFSSGKLDGWKVRSFDGETRYQVVDLDGKLVLKAETDKSASALYRKVDIDLRKTPYLNWSCRIENIHTIADQSQWLVADIVNLQYRA